MSKFWQGMAPPSLLSFDSIEFDCQGFNATIKILPPADQVVQKQTSLGVLADLSQPLFNILNFNTNRIGMESYTKAVHAYADGDGFFQKQTAEIQVTNGKNQIPPAERVA
jgi:hypothetical protein